MTKKGWATLLFLPITHTITHGWLRQSRHLGLALTPSLRVSIAVVPLRWDRVMHSGEKLKDKAGGFPWERRESSPSVVMLKVWRVLVGDAPILHCGGAQVGCLLKQLPRSNLSGNFCGGLQSYLYWWQRQNAERDRT